MKAHNSAQVNHQQQLTHQQQEQYNNYVAGEEVKFTSNPHPIKKRNEVKTTHQSHNVGHSSSISNRQHVPQVQSQALLEKPGIDSEDEDFEEPPEQRAILKSLANLPGITASDSMSYRIEALRVHLEN